MAKIIGSAGPDRLEGTPADDFIHGLGGDDILRGGAGADHLNGGGGLDELIHDLDPDLEPHGAGRGVTVDFATGEAVDPYGDVDLITGIEAVRGTAARDALGGSDAAFERFSGLAGVDVIDGRGGEDMADYSHDADYGGVFSIRANLRKHRAYDGFGDLDHLTGVESVRGTARNDRINGDAADNRLEGGAGHDRLTGIGGADILVGDEGRDRLSGGVGADVLDGGADHDILNGGRGRDVFRFDAGDGDDKIMRFERGRDLIAFSADAAGGFEDLTFRDSADGLLIGYEGGTITVVRMGADPLTADDFLFA